MDYYPAAGVGSVRNRKICEIPSWETGFELNPFLAINPRVGRFWARSENERNSSAIGFRNGWRASGRELKSNTPCDDSGENVFG